MKQRLALTKKDGTPKLFSFRDWSKIFFKEQVFSKKGGLTILENDFEVCRK